MKTILDLPINDKQRIAKEMKMSVVDWERYIQDTLSKLNADVQRNSIDMSASLTKAQKRFVSDLDPIQSIYISAHLINKAFYPLHK